MDFCALDFETATWEASSACEIGLCVVESGTITSTKSWLIKPPSYPYFAPRNIDVHGITPEMVKDAPTFADIYYEVKDYFYGLPLVAHNAAFDIRVLRHSLQFYGIFSPKLDYLCSVQVSRKAWKNLPGYGLKALANHHNIPFNHHRAGDDAEVCAKITLLALQKMMIDDVTMLREVYPKLMKQLKD